LLYNPATFQHVLVVATTITKEVHLLEPKHRYCKPTVLSCTQIHFMSPSTQSLLNI